MASRCILALATALCLPGAAQAGAWPRERGAVFASATVRLSWPQDLEDWQSLEPTGQYHTFYVEYGLTDRLTVGLDLGRSVSGGGKAVGFLRLPLLAPDARLKLAVELGLGQIEGRPVARPGLSLGMSLRNGWLSADGLAEIGTDGSGTDAKLDLTWGWNLPKDRKLILQLQTGAPDGDPVFARFAPSIVVPVKGPISAELGGTWGLVGDTSMGVMFGLWAEF